MQSLVFLTFGIRLEPPPPPPLLVKEGLRNCTVLLSKFLIVNVQEQQNLSISYLKQSCFTIERFGQRPGVS